MQKSYAKSETKVPVFLMPIIQMLWPTMTKLEIWKLLDKVKFSSKINEMKLLTIFYYVNYF